MSMGNGKTLDFRSLLGRYSTALLLVVLVILFSLFGDSSPQTLGDYRSLVLSSTGLLITVAGLSLVMLGGNVDLSIGYQISLMSVSVTALSALRLPDWSVILGVVLVGLLCGGLNGLLVGYLKIIPFAATIATQVIFRGLSFVISRGRMSSNMVDSIRRLIRADMLGIRVDLWLAMGAMGLLWLLLRGTFWGKHQRAIGLDEPAAIRAGVRVSRVKFLSYCFASFFYAVAALVLTSRRGYSGSEIGVGLEITATVAAYIGGILTFARKRSLMSLFLGTMVVAVVDNGLVRVGMNIYIQYIITGIILIVSMTLHNRRKNKE